MSSDPHTLVDAGLVTVRQLDHWVRKGYLKPGAALPGSGYRRVWSDDELRVAKRMALLVDAGLRPDVAAVVARKVDGPVTLASGITLQMAEVA